MEADRRLKRLAAAVPVIFLFLLINASLEPDCGTRDCATAYVAGTIVIAWWVAVGALVTSVLIGPLASYAQRCAAAVLIGDVLVVAVNVREVANPSCVSKCPVSGSFALVFIIFFVCANSLAIRVLVSRSAASGLGNRFNRVADELSFRRVTFENMRRTAVWGWGLLTLGDLVWWIKGGSGFQLVTFLLTLTCTIAIALTGENHESPQSAKTGPLTGN